jgi:hypothetical protein
MKLPFSFGTNLLFRLVFPGMILAAAAAPGLEALLRALAVPEPVEPLTYIPVMVVFFGWFVSLCDMPIYMLYEGRRFWPDRLLRWGLRREERRLRHLEEVAERARRADDQRRFVEASVEMSRFPLDRNGEPYAAMPTRLGNLIHEYETYPRQKYGLDSVFFFYRLWVAIDDDLREELDSKQAAVDGSLYLSFCLLLTALSFLGYALLQLFSGAVVPWVGPWWFSLLLALAAMACSALVYRLSLQAHAQYGEFYKALFDQHRTKLDFKDVLAYLAEATGDPQLASLGVKEANMAVWRYLRWHKIRLPGEDSNRSFEEVVRLRKRDAESRAAGGAGERTRSLLPQP